MPLELIVGAAVGAAVASPSVRKVVRRGLIYGLGNVLIAYDKVAAVTHGAVEGARKGVATVTDAEAPAADGTTPGTSAATSAAAPIAITGTPPAAARTS
jgi:hypothetical protein